MDEQAGGDLGGRLDPSEPTATFGGAEALASLAHSAPVGLASLESDGTLRAANDTFIRLLGGVDGAVDWDRLDGGFDAVRGTLESVQTGQPHRLVIDSAGRTVRLRFERIDGGGIQIAVEDVSAAMRIADDLARAASQFRAAFDHAPIGMALVSVDGRFRRVNERLCDIVGTTGSDLSQRLLTDIVDPAHIPVIEAIHQRASAGERTDEVECRLQRIGGDVGWITVTLAPVSDGSGKTRHLVLQVQDVTQRKLAEQALRDRQEELAFRATHDELTGLPNRRLLVEHLDLALRRLPRSDLQLAVLFLDLDDFKPVNDTFGHEAGDVVLVAVAERLRDALRTSDVVARYGGDEFVIVCDGIHHDVEASLVAARVLRSMEKPIDVGDDQRVVVGVSIGIAVATTTDSVASVIARADEAVYAAKTGTQNPVLVPATEIDLSSPAVT